MEVFIDVQEHGAKLQLYLAYNARSSLFAGGSLRQIGLLSTKKGVEPGIMMCVHATREDRRHERESR